MQITCSDHSFCSKYMANSYNKRFAHKEKLPDFLRGTRTNLVINFRFRLSAVVMNIDQSSVCQCCVYLLGS